MPNYKEMYLMLLQASEKAINILIEAQRKSEEIYISSPEPELTLMCIKAEKDIQAGQNAHAKYEKSP